MNLGYYSNKLTGFFKKVEDENVLPEEWYINAAFPKSSDDFINLVICYVFFHHQPGKRTKVHQHLVKDIIVNKQLNLKL